MHAEKPDRVGFDIPPVKPSIPLSTGFENFLRTNVGEKPGLAKGRPACPRSGNVVLSHGADGRRLRSITTIVEDSETLEFLRAAGSDYAQGFLLGRPAAAGQRTFNLGG